MQPNQGLGYCIQKCYWNLMNSLGSGFYVGFVCDRGCKGGLTTYKSLGLHHQQGKNCHLAKSEMDFHFARTGLKQWMSMLNTKPRCTLIIGHAIDKIFINQCTRLVTLHNRGKMNLTERTRIRKAIATHWYTTGATGRQWWWSVR